MGMAMSGLEDIVYLLLGVRVGGQMKVRSGLLILLSFLLCSTETLNAAIGERWRAPFGGAETQADRKDSPLTFQEIVDLVADRNPALKSLRHDLDAARHRLRQAGLWPNPEFETEIDEFGLDAPGFQESEITVALAQEFELFGQRGARKDLFRAGLRAEELHTRIAAYDLYLKTKSLFYTLAHAAEQLRWTESSVGLAEGILDNVTFRISRGAALQSELQLARLELQRAQLEHMEARQELETARTSLVSLWSDEPTGITVRVAPEPDFDLVLDRLMGLTAKADSSRHVLQLAHQIDVIQAEKHLASTEAKPTVTLRGGYKRLESNDSNSLILGIAVPLPLWDRNQHSNRSLEAQLRSAEYEMKQARLDANVIIHTGTTRLRQLVERHAALEAQMLPIAEEAFVTLREAYQAGRVPYTSLLEAERSLVGLRFEHNDVVLSIHQQIIELERIVGLTVCTDNY
jgi:cobalt-zinc-cadmium efflux system outer membrane protein